MLIFRFQKELAINANVTVPAIGHSVVNARTAVSYTLKSPKDTHGEGQMVSTVRTLSVTE